MFCVHDQLYVRKWQVGLMTMRGDSLALMPGGEAFSAEEIYVMLPYDEHRILVGTRTKGLFLDDSFDEARGQGRFTSFETEADAFMLANQIYQPGALLSGGRFVLGTVGGGAVVLNRQGRLLQVINRIAGLPSNSVNNIYVDQVGALWLAMDRGISQVDLTSPLTRFEETSGVPNSVNSV
jgi:ligand-binding sensor domain-containing protein